jgi:hypothetical protein
MTGYDRNKDWDPIALDGDWCQILEIAEKKSMRIRLAYAVVVKGEMGAHEVLSVAGVDLQQEWHEAAKNAQSHDFERIRAYFINFISDRSVD